MLLICCPACIISNKKYVILIFVPLYVIFLVSLAVFKIFFFIVSFEQFDLVYFSSCFAWGLLSFLNMQADCLHNTWENSGQYFCKSFFCPHPFLFPFIAEWYLEVRAWALGVLLWYWNVIASRPCQGLGHICKYTNHANTCVCVCLLSFFCLSVLSIYLSIIKS